jgi:hypothetical protein
MEANSSNGDALADYGQLLRTIAPDCAVLCCFDQRGRLLGSDGDSSLAQTAGAATRSQREALLGSPESSSAPLHSHAPRRS